MYTHRRPADEESKPLRKQGGAWLKTRREALGLSQSQLAKLVGTDHYTFVSQVEIGARRIAPDRMEVWAEALQIAPREFARELLRYYDPHFHRLLFENERA